MDVFKVIKERRSCRNFLPGAVAGELIDQVLEAGNWAPSPANQQPWEFVVIRNAAVKEQIYEEGVQCKRKLLERSGWKWLDSYHIDFIKEAPVVIAIIGDPKKSGADMFLDEGTGRGYLEACSAVIQNMMLAAHALGLGSLWFTVFEAASLRKTLGLDPGKDPVGLVCLGKSAGGPAPAKRKDFREKTLYMD
jgi:5,6-dimethylbenzimidazole synthase